MQELNAAALKVPSTGSLADGETEKFDGFSVKALLTPGHTPGSACYLVGSFLFTGDTLFKNDIVKIPADSRSEEAEAQDRLIRLIREKLLVFEDGTRVCPGHGPTSSIAEEKANNPFFK